LHARHLEVEAIVATAERLSGRVTDRFEGRGISRLADELVVVSRETGARLDRLDRPRWGLRVLVACLILFGLILLVLSASRLSFGSEIEGIDDWLAVTQNGIQDVVFIGIAVIFLVTVESRVSRRAALAGLHELRSIAHVIDMHQLTKDPDSVLHPELRTSHSPDRSLDRFQLSRYLDYCSELLSLTSKLAALYAQQSSDAVVLSTVREVQELTGMLSNKIWQKVSILDMLDEPGGGPGGVS
jgi:hypothetical protein